MKNKTLLPILLASPLLQQAAVAQPKPNIIFVLVDDLRWDAMGFFGKYPYLQTPNIDKLRNEGVHFANAYCTHSLSAPSRASILTGMYPQSNGVITNQEGREFNPDVTPSFPKILQDNGYMTAFIGKWHMNDSRSPRVGFNYWCAFSGQGNYNSNILNINGKDTTDNGYITDELNNFALKFITNNVNTGKPFCLYLSHKAVHEPFIPAVRDQSLYASDQVPEPASWVDDLTSKPAWQRLYLTKSINAQRLRDKDIALITPMSKRQFGTWPIANGIGSQKDYHRCISAVDDGLGEIYDLLKSKGILNNTIIVFTGDNGYFHGEHGLGDKRLSYNEAMRVPLVMRYPPLITASSTVNKMALNIDFAPTFLDLASVSIPSRMQGKSLLPLFNSNPSDWRTSFMFTYWVDLKPFLPRLTAVRTENYLYSKAPDLNDIDELYNDAADPAEMINLANNPTYAALKESMNQKLDSFKTLTGYQDWVPRPETRPVSALKTGKVLQIDFTTLDYTKTTQNGMTLTAVSKSVSDNEVSCAFNTNSRVSITNTTDLNPSDGHFIVDCTVKINSSSGVVCSAGNVTNGWAMYIENGIPGFVVAHAGLQHFVDASASVANRWAHIVGVIENFDNFVKLYVDGQFIGQRQMILPIQTINGANESKIILGHDDYALVDSADISNFNFNGQIMKFNIYRQDMTDADLKTLSAPNVVTGMSDLRSYNNSFIYVKNKTISASTIGDFRICNFQGVEVLKATHKKSIDSNLTSGIYLVDFLNENKERTIQKILIQ